ncbi:hypothetical protein COLO4_09906 [Corchorus olitorius]|uniref:F-box associated beta-propeller type 3 domain-containing protein n=1 Tax=Corchorus olitorius TaxID=93759 RepID=A0A1R3KAQ7_9ROSI|nr:hypothetical protein COLO4_09906 [Corchorus olitorius]
MVYVYTLGTDNSWRRIFEDHLPMDRISSELPGVCLNGALHWLTCLKIKSDDRKPRIYCFDLDSETFHQLDHDLLPQLPITRWGDNKSLEGLKLGVLDNCLALYINGACFPEGYFSNFDIWVMKDEKSWANIFRISGAAPSSVWKRIEPLMLTEDGKMLIIYNDEKILLKYYDLRTGMFIADRWADHVIGYGSIKYIGHVASLVSPQHIMMKKSTAATNF